jgi:hypothetical protein
LAMAACSASMDENVTLGIRLAAFLVVA